MTAVHVKDLVGVKLKNNIMKNISHVSGSKSLTDIFRSNL